MTPRRFAFYKDLNGRLHLMNTMADTAVGGGGSTGNTGIREIMKDFWAGHSSSPSLESMMLDTEAAVLTEMESQEILSVLPDLTGKRILELGAGIGRHTRLLAQNAGHVTAVDFIQSFVEQNRQYNGHLKNVQCLQADATQLEFPPNSYNIVFSNWLMMYLADEEVVKLFRNALTWLEEDGYIFFRESCFHPGGDIHNTENPTMYRSPAQYKSLFQTAFRSMKDKADTPVGCTIVSSRALQTYIKLKDIHNQFCWLLQKKAVIS